MTEFKFRFVDNEGDEEWSEEFTYAATVPFRHILSDAAEQFGYESGAAVFAVAGDQSKDDPPVLPTATAEEVFIAVGGKLRICPRTDGDGNYHTFLGDTVDE